jgi:hypothetical protein
MAETSNGCTTQDVGTSETDPANSVTFGSVIATTMGEEPDADDVLAPLSSRLSEDPLATIGAPDSSTGFSEDPLASTGAPDPSTEAPSGDVPVRPSTPRPRLERQNRNEHLDIATGMTTRRTQDIREVMAERPANRWKKMMSRMHLVEHETAESFQDSDDDQQGRINVPKKQFRIRSKRLDEDGRISFDLYAQRPVQVAITEYLHWCFKATFGEVILISFIWFMLLNMVFAPFIFWAASYQPECIVFPGDDTLPDDVEQSFVFMDAFHLSWTTLSTVGYGVVYPNTASQEARCIGINILCAFESFVGVLFGGVTGAIIFGKVARAQSIAQVLFSHPICVRYGSGVSQPTKTLEQDRQQSSFDLDPDESEAVQLPCPILEFRLVNEFSNQWGGEIMNAAVHVVGCTLAAKAEEDIISERRKKGTRNSIVDVAGKSVAETAKFATKSATKATKTATKKVKKTGAALLGAGKSAGKATGSIIQKLNKQLMKSPRESTDDQEGAVPYSERELEKELEKEVQARFEKEFEKTKTELASLLDPDAKASVTVDEGHGALAPRRIYHPLKIETDTHPFFKRVWTIRHVLDATSPLLSNKARRAIEANGGFWPEELNNYTHVRNHLNFHEIIVSFSGTANASGSSVYAQKVYDYVDVNIGYSFASVLTMSDQQRLVVDHVLLNDVREQYGGGAEPFTNISSDPIGNVEQMAQRATSAAVAAAETATTASKAAA